MSNDWPDSQPPADSYAYDVFISYSSKDQAWVRGPLLQRLEGHGLRVCIDFRDFRPGAPFVTEMERAVLNSRYTLIVLTPDFVNSSWTQFEEVLTFTIAHGFTQRRVIPLLKAACEPPLRIQALTAVDFTDPQAYEFAYTRLLAAIDPAFAEVQMQQIPLDTVPAPTFLPPGSRMPLSHNPLFVGRDDELRELARVLKAGETVAIGQIAAATGLGGIGKTQLAAEFVHRYGQFFTGGVFWLSFADPDVVPSEIAACGGIDGMRLSVDFDKLPLSDQVRLVQAEWRSSAPRLLVFDSCEDEELFNGWKPPSGGCRVLITSRRAQWDQTLSVHALHLEVLARAESIALLRKFLPDLPPDDAHLNTIADTLGDLPLALHLAGKFLTLYQKDISLAEYIAEIKASSDLQHESLKRKRISPTGQPQSLARTFQLSYERLDSAKSIDTLALQLLARAAYFAPGIPIARTLLKMTLQRPPEELRKVAQALRRLVNLGLLEEAAEDAFRLHRLLAIFVRSISLDTGARKAVEEAVLNYVQPLNEVRDPRPLLAIQAHLYFITNAAQQQEDEQIIHLRNEIGHHLQMVGDYRGAQRYCEETLSISERVLGTEHPITATSWHNLGRILGTKGDNPGAVLCFERSLAIRKRMLGAEHPDTAECLMGIGCVLYAQGKYEEAEKYWQQTLTIRERMLGVEHPDTARALINLGVLRDAQGQYSEARIYLERALAIQEQSLGLEHQDTAMSLLSLGEVLYEQKEYGTAQAYFERALAIQRKVLGAEHPDTAYTLGCLGLVLDAQDSLPQARQLYEQALAIFEAHLGPDHRRTHIVRTNMLALDTQAYTTTSDESQRVLRRQRLR